MKKIFQMFSHDKSFVRDEISKSNTLLSNEEGFDTFCGDRKRKCEVLYGHPCNDHHSSCPCLPQILHWWLKNGEKC